MANEISAISVSLEKYELKDTSSRLSIDYILSSPGNVLLSTSVASSIVPAKVNFVTKERYEELSAAGELVSSEIYAVDGDPFSGGAKVTVQYWNANGQIQTMESDLSILCLSSNQQYEQLAYNDQLQANALYKVSSDVITALGKRIGSIAAPVDLSDAVTLEYFSQNTPVYSIIDIAVPSNKKCYVNNYSINVLSSGANSQLSIVFPPSNGRARDFIVRLVVGSTTPMISFVSESGSLSVVHANEIPAIEANSSYVMSFTEIDDDVFLYSLLNTVAYT